MLLCYGRRISRLSELNWLAADLRLLCHRTVRANSQRADKRAGRLTERPAVVQRGSEAAGVGVHGHVRGRGVQQGVSDDHGVDDALAGEGVEHRRGQVG